MKKALTAAAVLLALALCFATALAGGGTAGDPLVSLSYLNGIFASEVETAVDSRLLHSDEALRADTQNRLAEMNSAVLAAANRTFAASFTENTLNQGDSLSGTCGLSVIPLAGDISLTVTTGTVIDASTGQEIDSGTILTARHRYIVAENSSAFFNIESPTATLSYQGDYAYYRNTYGVDYYGIALALRALDLFRGSGSGIGEGFDLHRAPTRAEALVMFIRILGEEDEALACTYTHPFKDVPEWLDRYAAWAYYKGYTNGISPTQFGTQSSITIEAFQEFILRALGYSVAGVDDYLTSMERAVTCGALTDVEYIVMKNCDFRRAHVAYLCYYTLDTPVAGSFITLGQQLQLQSVFTQTQLDYARTFVNSTRLH